MRPFDLIEVAELLLSSNDGQPAEVSLRRAASSTYYALFHFLAAECANSMVGDDPADRSEQAWQQTYRALEHGYVRDRCRQQAAMLRFSAEIREFAEDFLTLQIKRHDADYGFSQTFTPSVVRKDILSARRAIVRFAAAPARDRRAFCAFVLLKERKS